MNKHFFITTIAFFVLLSTAQAETPPSQTSIRLNQCSIRLLLSGNNLKILEDSPQTTLFDVPFQSVTAENFRFYNTSDSLRESILGTDTSSPFATSAPDALSFTIYRELHTNDKFILSDVNNDSLLDLITIKEQRTPESGYLHSIFLGAATTPLSSIPNKTFLESSSTWISGIYSDVNLDGFPEKITIKYQQSANPFSTSTCIIELFAFNNKLNRYESSPFSKVAAKGSFFDKQNLVDVNGDNYPDIIVMDYLDRPKTIQEAIARLFQRKATIQLNFFYYNKKTGGFPPVSDCSTEIPISLTQDFSVNFVPDAGNNFKDLVVNGNGSAFRKHFNPKTNCFNN